MTIILNGTTGISGVDGTAATPAFKGNDSNTGITFGTDTVTINTGGTARVTTDASGNVGIGSGNLTFTGSAQRITWNMSPAAISDRVFFQTNVVNGASDLNIMPNGTGVGANFTAFSSSDPANSSLGRFGVSSSTGVTFLNSFKLGTGVTLPIAFQIDSTERMRLDASGNLGLGVTPSAWNSANPAIQFTGEVSISRFGFGRNAYYDGTNYRYITTNVATLYQQSSGNHTWNVAPSGTAGNAISFTQAMTLTAAGYLGIGTTSPSTKLHVVDGAIRLTDAYEIGWGANSVFLGGNSSTNNLLFYTNTTERARIDSSGNLLVGVTATGTPAVGYIFNSNGFLQIGRASGAAQSTIGFYNGSTFVGEIRTSTTATTYATSSDYRLKENVAPMTGALAKVAQLKPCTYTWKTDGSAGQGFIAHELQAVVPDAVTGERDAVDADGKPQYQGVDTSFLVATLTAAIQELTARLEVLENK